MPGFQAEEIVARKGISKCGHDYNQSCAVCKHKHPFVMPKTIVDASLKGDLAFFVGAGVSTESRNVLPLSIYEEVSLELGLSPTTNTHSFSELMSTYCKQHNGRPKLITKIIDKIKYVYSFNALYGMATRFHRELATLAHLQDIFTTNWDDYMEKECGAVSFCSAEDLVYWNSATRRVFKLHGSINNLSTIVATKEDYDRCYRSLHNGMLGAALKLALATKTIVYVGYSCQDEDFVRLCKSINSQMKGLTNQHYIVDINDKNKSKYEQLGLELIVTDGEYFVHQLKQHLIKHGCQLSDERFVGVSEMLQRIVTIHRSFANQMNLASNPQAIYTLAYHDGIEDGFLRILRMQNTGEYSCPSRILALVEKYIEMHDTSVKQQEYTDAAYYEGYGNALMYLPLSDKERDSFPVYYIYKSASSSESVHDIAEYNKLCGKYGNGRTRPVIKAKRMIEEGGWTNKLYPQFFPYVPKC